MFKLLKDAVAYFWGRDDDEDVLEKAYAVLAEPEAEKEDDDEWDEEEEQRRKRNLCRQKLGHVTKSEKGGLYVIDDRYNFKAPNESYRVGAKVSYKLFVDDGAPKVSNVEAVEEEFCDVIEGDTTWICRTIVGKVCRREGRVIFVHPDDVKVDLNTTEADFIPVVGDWVELYAKCEINRDVRNFFGDILEVQRIKPLRSKVVKGVVKVFDVARFLGQVDADVFFDKEALCDGYLPRVGDKVLADVIESSHKGAPIWRALKVMLQAAAKQSFRFDVPKLLKYEEDVDGVDIKGNLEISVDRFDDHKIVPVQITNESPTPLELLGVSFDSKISQAALIKPSFQNPVTILEGKTLPVIFRVQPKCVGRSEEVVVFRFGHCNVGRVIAITLQVNGAVTKGQYRRTDYTDRTRNYVGQLENQIIRGVPINVAPRFVASKIGLYKIPQNLWKVFLKVDSSTVREINQDLIAVKPCLLEELSFATYEDKFHTLLYLEEIQSVISARCYDQDLACFVRNGEYLMLEVENLSELRPSIIVSDRIIATNPVQPTQKFEGVVHKVGSRHVYLKFAGHFHDSYAGEDYSVHVEQSRVPIRKLHHAVHLAERNLGRDILFPRRVPVKRGGYDGEIAWRNASLNYFQKEAVRNVLRGEARPLPYVIFGPPGTGKTVTVVETALQLLTHCSHARLLIAAPSNSAANILARRLIDSGLLQPGDLVRFCSYNALIKGIVPEDLLPYCMTGNLSKEGVEVEDIFVGGKAQETGIGRHKVTVGTCTALATLHMMSLTRGHFTHILVDEAGQCSEPQIMAPLVFLDPNEGQVILAGDPKQLGPVIQSRHSKEFGMDVSFLERLVNKFPYIRDVQSFPEFGGYDPRLVTRLVYNYRSLPGIIRLPNQLFYHSELEATISETKSAEAEFLKKFAEILPAGNKTASLMFHGLKGENYQTEESPSWYNPSEASQVFYYVNELYRLGACPEDVGIITPYTQQVQQIRKLLNEAEFVPPKIGSVEEFQGHEFRVVLLSTVRSDPNLVTSYDLRHRMGFISNPKRFNVAVTRAQCLCVVIGDPFLLSRDQCWRALLQHCIKEGAYVGCKLDAEMCSS